MKEYRINPKDRTVTLIDYDNQVEAGGYRAPAEVVLSLDEIATLGRLAEVMQEPAGEQRVFRKILRSDGVIEKRMV
jgi:hypothetical protein